MRIRCGLLTTALTLVLTTGLAAAPQDEKYQADIRDQFGRWLDPKLESPNVTAEEAAMLEGVDPSSGVLEFPGKSIVWRFAVPAGKTLAHPGDVKKTLEGVLGRYLGKQVEQALESVPPAERPQLLARLRSDAKVVGFDGDALGLGDESKPQPPPEVVTLASSQMLYASSQMCWPSPATTAFTAELAASGEGYVAREVLIRGKSARDWESLFNRGYSDFRAGRHRQAAEYFAAAAELSDDTLAWDFLAFASLMSGEHASASEAARYSAARVVQEPELRDRYRFVLAGVDGSLRGRLRQLQQGVDDPRVAGAVLASRPRLIPAGGPKAVEVVTHRPRFEPTAQPLD